MKPQVLLINPWIYDFAAANLWSRPLGLLKAAEHLSAYNLDLKLIDCLDSYKPRRFNTGNYPKTAIPRPEPLHDVRRKYSRYGISIDEFTEQLKRKGPYDAILVTSIMTYWYPGVAEAIKTCKEIFPDVPVLLGGIYATLHKEHASRVSGADMLYTGKIEDRIVKLFDKIGITIKRTRKALPYYKLEFYEKMSYAPLLTAEGCPYRCSYCASALLSDGYKQREVSQVIGEIRELYSRGVTDIAFYDDALFFNADGHIKRVLNGVVEDDIKVRFHTPNGLHARYIDNELALLMKRSGFTTVRMSLETVNEQRLRSTGGKVTRSELYYAVQRLKNNGFTKNGLGVYLMYGLPGQGIEEVRESVRFIMDLDVKVHLSEFSPIPGTASWDELVKDGKITDDIDPLLTNNTVFSLLNSHYSAEDIRQLKDDVIRHNSAV
jgi:radical SAM superfamily enzyme YgiQ (UPF0313 family)